MQLDAGPWQRIGWKAPEGHIAEAQLLAGLTSRASGSLGQLVKTLGVPHVAGATPLEEARVLLRAASEVEHALLVEYLYVAWSVATAPIADAIIGIAIQEMCHFITVQNLMLFLGSMPSVNRQDQDPEPALDPFPFTLRPFSKSVIEDFLLTEMPSLDQMTPQQKVVMQPIVDKAKQLGRLIHPVGLIYAKLYWLFQGDDFPTQDWPAIASAGFDPGRHIGSFPGSGTATTFQVDPLAERKWNSGQDRGGIFEVIASRDAALRAVFDIASQGEGVQTSGDQSHFERFLDIYNTTDFTALSATNWPTDPFVAVQPSNDPAQEANRITNSAAAAVSRVLDLRYQIALASIRASLSRDRSKPADLAVRTKYVRWAFDEMLGFIKGLSQGLATLPCKAEGGALLAAPTFAIQGFALPNDAAGLDDALAKLHSAAAVAIKAATSAGLDAGLQSLIDTMRQNDQTRYPPLVS
jgi:hypothetical protein